MDEVKGDIVNVKIRPDTVREVSEFPVGPRFIVLLSL